MTYDIPALIAEGRAALDPRSLMWDKVKVDLVRRLVDALDDLHENAAEHDRQVAEKAWDEGYRDDYGQRDSGKDRNPYRKQEPNDVPPLKPQGECNCDADGILHDTGCPLQRKVSLKDVIRVGGKHVINTGEGGVWHLASWDNGQRSGCDCTVGRDHPVAEVRIRFDIKEPSWD